MPPPLPRHDFAVLMARLGDAWIEGSAVAAAACFAQDVDYADPTRYRFSSRAALLPFFEPPEGGHTVTWHRIVYDEETGHGAVEYTYVGHHRYHGAAFVETGEDGLISAWREYQHQADDQDFDAFVAGPAPEPG